MTDMSDTIERLGDFREYTVTRFDKAGVTGGKPNPKKVLSEFLIKASVQPASGRDLQRLPEGMRDSQTIAIWTKDELFVADEATQQYPDEVIYRGKRFQVEVCEPWEEAGNFFEALARKI